MPDTYDTYLANPANVSPLARAICNGMPKTVSGATIGPCITDQSLRAILNAIAALEA